MNYNSIMPRLMRTLIGSPRRQVMLALVCIVILQAGGAFPDHGWHG